MTDRRKMPTTRTSPPPGRAAAHSRTFELETPIRTMIDATNRGDTETLLGAFANDAVLVKRLLITD